MDKEKNFYVKLLKLTAPIAFQALMLSLVAVSDALMLGNVEQDSMTAVSLATQIQFVQNIILFTVTTSTSILGAQYWGKEDKASVRDILCIGLRFSLVISLVTFLGCEFFPRYLMLAFTNEEVLINIGIGYLKLAGWSYLITGISQLYLTVMKVSNHVVMCATISSTAVVLNIIFNAILIYGMFGLKPMGVEGAALATLLSRVAEFVWVVALSFGKDYIRPSFKGLISWNKLLLKDFIKCALPLLGANLFWGIGFTSYTSFMGHLGKDAGAANSVTAVIRDMVCCFCDGISAGAGIMVGNELGAGNLEKGKLYGKRIAVIAFICGFICMLIMFALSPLVVHLVKLTPQAATYLRGMMIVMAIYMIGRCVNTIVINGIFSAGGDTMFDFYSLAVCMWGVAIPLAALGTYVFHFPVVLVYAFTCLDEVGKIPWVMHHFRKYKWVKDLTR